MLPVLLFYHTRQHTLGLIRRGCAETVTAARTRAHLKHPINYILDIHFLKCYIFWRLILLDFNQTANYVLLNIRAQKLDN